MFLKSLLILWFSFFVFACGYTPVGRPTFLQPEWKTIYIPPWKNFTGESALGELLAKELRLRIAQEGYLTPVFSEEEADLILWGEILKVYFEPLAYDVFLVTKTRSVQFEGKYFLLEKKTGKKLYENPKISKSDTYRVREESSTLLNPGKKEVLNQLVKDLGELIIQEIFY